MKNRMVKTKKLRVLFVTACMLLLTGCATTKPDEIILESVDTTVMVSNTEKCILESVTETNVNSVTNTPIVTEIVETTVQTTVPVTTTEEVTTVVITTEETTVPVTTIEEETSLSSISEDIAEDIVTETIESVAPSVTVGTPPPRNIPPLDAGEIPQDIQDYIELKQSWHPDLKVGVGIYSLDGSEAYEYHPWMILNSGCTVKAAYGLYVLEKCEEMGKSIYSYNLTYKYGMRNEGSGIIKNHEYDSQYSVYALLEVLLQLSDNTAYNILLSEFPLDDFQSFLDEIGGQKLWGNRFGSTCVRARRNEWFAIMDYLNSDRLYSEELEKFLSNNQYYYIKDGMSSYHYMISKSGWATESYSYCCAGECAVFDNKYLVVVLSQDHSSYYADTSLLAGIGGLIEDHFL